MYSSTGSTVHELIWQYQVDVLQNDSFDYVIQMLNSGMIDSSPT